MNNAAKKLLLFSMFASPKSIFPLWKQYVDLAVVKLDYFVLDRRRPKVGPTVPTVDEYDERQPLCQQCRARLFLPANFAPLDTMPAPPFRARLAIRPFSRHSRQIFCSRTRVNKKFAVDFFDRLRKPATTTKETVRKERPLVGETAEVEAITTSRISVIVVAHENTKERVCSHL